MTSSSTKMGIVLISDGVIVFSWRERERADRNKTFLTLNDDVMMIHDDVIQSLQLRDRGAWRRRWTDSWEADRSQLPTRSSAHREWITKERSSHRCIIVMMTSSSYLEPVLELLHENLRAQRLVLHRRVPYQRVRPARHLALRKEKENIDPI